MIDNIKKISGKLTWSLIGNVVYALSQWVIITIIARYGNANDLGIYNIGLAVTAPIFLFFSFQLRLILVTDSEKKHTFSEFLSSRLIHMVLAYFTIIPIAFIYGDNREIVLVIILMGLVKFFESLSDICLGFFQKKSQIDQIGKSQLLRGIYTVIIFCGTYYLSESILLSIIGLTLVMFVRFLFYDLKHVKENIKVKLVFNKVYLDLIKTAYPLGITSLIVSLNTNLPRYILDKTIGIEAVGVFSVLYYVLIAVNMFMAPIMLLIAPKIAKSFTENNNQFIKLNMIISIIIVTVFLMIFVPLYPYTGNMLGKLYGIEYIIYKSHLDVLLISLLFGFLIELFNITIITMRSLKLHMIINIIVGIITLLTGLVLINTHGLIGASYTILISRITQLVLSVILIGYSIKKNDKYSFIDKD